ncbi:MAG: tellurite resistance TerB family protein [Cytophagales bacterium]|nr:tellurite resistance TerB family protein [Cytophagales bacterium]
MLNELSPEEFSLFIVIHMASVDGTVHPTELDAIRSKAAGLFPHIQSIQEKIDETQHAIAGMGKEAAEQFVDDNLKLLASLTPPQRTTLHQFLLDIINADGKVKEDEMRTLRKLRTVLTAP